MKQLLSVIFVLRLVFAVYAQENKVSLLFVGDAMQHLPQVNAAKKGHGFYYDSCFYLLKEKIANADIACVNFETTLGGKPYTGYPMFSSPRQFAESLKNTGFDIFFLANNHILDRGKSGLERTIDILDSLRVKHTGVFKSKNSRGLSYPLMVIKNGIRIAFINYTYDTNGLKTTPPNIVNLIDTLQIKRDLRLTSLYKPDIVIANMHWGEEYFVNPSRKQKQLADFLFRNGVRIIIGHHPHVVQPMVKNTNEENIQSVVYYSLGNFISNQQKTNTDGGAIAEIVIRKIDDEIIIDSCDYSLVWVRKFKENNKLKYVLIPAEHDLEKIKPSLVNEELQRMNIFVKNANQIIKTSNLK